MAATRARVSSFSRNVSTVTSQNPGLKHGPNGTMFISSGIPDLDKILGGGFSLGSLVMVMEDPEAPHHMLLLRNFMSQGLVQKQPLLYASASRDPKSFLGTLPSLVSPKGDKSSDLGQEKDLRIAWQYKKYFGEPQLNLNTNNDTNIMDDINRNEGSISSAGRIAIQSFCSPQCKYSNEEWHMLSFIRSLKGMARSSNAVIVVTFPPSLLPPSCSKRLQHMADTLLSVKAIPDEDKELAKLLTGYQDMIGLLNVHKVARLNTQVPVILEATTFSIKLQKRRFLVLECLNQAPVDGSSGSSYGTSGGCSGSTKAGSLDF